MPSDESKGSQLDAIGSLAQRQLDNTAVRPRAARRAKARPPRPAAVARSVSTTTTATAASLALKHGATGSRQCAAAILRIPTCEMPTGTELSASGERRTVDDKRDVDLLQVVDQGLPTPYSTRSAYS